MRHLFLLLGSLYLTAQKTLPTFDGIVSEKEWVNAEKFKINYEIDLEIMNHQLTKLRFLLLIPKPIYM